MGKNNVYYLAQNKYRTTKVRKWNKKNRLLLLLIIFVLFLAAYFYLSFQRIEIIMARYGEVVDGFPAQILIVRDEFIQYTSDSGQIKLRQSEGQRIGYGEVVMEIGDTILHNYRSGIVSYAVDGLEEILRPESVFDMDLKKYDNLDRDYKQLVNGQYLKKGQASYRIINNNKMLVVLKTTVREINRYLLNETVFLNSKDLQKDLIDGVIIKKITDGESGFLIIELNVFEDEWLNLRWADITFIKNIYRGIVIPRSAVFTRPDGEGVLLVNPDGNYKFQQIKVLDGNNEDIVVEGIEVGESVVENPAVVNYGGEV